MVGNMLQSIRAEPRMGPDEQGVIWKACHTSVASKTRLPPDVQRKKFSFRPFWHTYPTIMHTRGSRITITPDVS